MTEFDVASLKAIAENVDKVYHAGYDLYRAILNKTIDKVTAKDLEGFTEIKMYTFYGCKKLVSVEIPENIITICSGAFHDCNALEYLNIPESVTQIGTKAFYLCRSLKKITIPKNVKDIYASCFNGCESLESIKLHNDINSLGDNAFSGCSKLKNFSIPPKINRIPSYCFSNCYGLTSITIPGGVTSIGYYALKIGTSINKATITMLGKKPPTIQSNTFYPTYLDKVKVPWGWEGLFKKATNWSAIASYVEPDKSLLYEITSSDFNSLGIDTIAESMFMDCYNLESVEIPSVITLIENYAFKNCYSLKKVILPTTMTNNIGRQAFHSCESLEEVILPNGIKNVRGACFYLCTSLRKVVIPESVTTITGTAFYRCDSLTELTIPSNVTLIGEVALKIGTSSNKATITMLGPPPTIETDTFDTSRLKNIRIKKEYEAAYKKATNWSVLTKYYEVY